MLFSRYILRDSIEERFSEAFDKINQGIHKESHKEFAGDLDLPFTLLADEDDAIRTAYGVKPALFGALPGRETFVIAKDGTIVARYADMFGVEKHITQALAALEPALVAA